MTYTVQLNCGHVARISNPITKGDWVSCWALMHPEPGCQTQRKVISVSEAAS